MPILGENLSIPSTDTGKSSLQWTLLLWIEWIQAGMLKCWLTYWSYYHVKLKNKGL